MLDECVDDGPGVFAGHSDQHHVTRMTLHQGRDLAVMTADDQGHLPSVPGTARSSTQAGRSRIETVPVILP